MRVDRGIVALSGVGLKVPLPAGAVKICTLSVAAPSPRATLTVAPDNVTFKLDMVDVILLVVKAYSPGTTVIVPPGNKLTDIAEFPYAINAPVDNKLKIVLVSTV